MRIELLVIDPQVDFCDPAGSLCVKGADDDMKRLAKMVKRLAEKIDDIHVTLDSHHLIDVAHPAFWVGKDGKHPGPFTIIKAQDVKDGTWTPTKPGLFKRMLAYVEKLEKGGKYPLCIWPPHCLIGTTGHNVYKPLMDELLAWEDSQFANVVYVTKGSNPYTEHYSAVKAEVPDPEDGSTQINGNFVQGLKEADLLLIAGEAGSHCLANTTRDIIAEFNDDTLVKKIVLLEDATSPVPGFENLQEQFIKDMKAKGMQVAKTKDFLV